MPPVCSGQGIDAGAAGFAENYLPQQAVQGAARRALGTLAHARRIIKWFVGLAP